jgi:hypothetical protein
LCSHCATDPCMTLLPRILFCYDFATGTAQTIPLHHDDGFSESSLFSWLRSCWVGSGWRWAELFISGP